MQFFTNGFSPFARKVALALEYKGLAYEPFDGLVHDNRDLLLAVNPRAEVPVLVDGDTTVVNSSDIVAYLDLKYPERPIYPAALKDRVAARALERLADTRIDAIMLDCSIWTWADRKDTPPPGLMEAGQADLDTIFARIETVLAGYPSPLPFGHLTIADFALWPHLAALRPLGFTMSTERYPRLNAWFAMMRRDDLTLWLSGPGTSAMKPMQNGSLPHPGGWNRLVIEVDDLDAAMAAVRANGARFRNDPVAGPGGLQVLVDDPSGNPIELFEANDAGGA